MSRVLRSTLILDSNPGSIRGRRMGSASAPAAGAPCAAPPRERGDSTDSGDPSLEGNMEDAIRNLLGAVEESVLAAEQSRRDSLEEFQQLAVELAVMVASEVVFRSIDREQFGVDGLVRAAVERLGLDAPLTLWLHPADLELLEVLASCELNDEPSVWRTGAVTIHPDPSLTRGHCRASNGATAVLSELGARLEEIRELLWEGLDDAQIERRNVAGDGQTLKRFPDRRATA